VLAAFLLGAAVSAGGWAAVVASGAAARGPFIPVNAVQPVAAYGETRYRATYSYVPIEALASTYPDGEARKPRHREQIRLISGRATASLTARVNFAAREPVCVRLCDGFFFPLTTAAYDATSQNAACNSLCPDAPTEVFYRNGSDRIEDAVSATGQPYTALPVSLRYRATADNTCSCHRNVVSYAPLRDVTLRRGDAVMTPAGFMVFRGAEGAPHRAGDFAALAKSPMPAARRGVLQALERVSVNDRHPTLKDWLISQTAPANPVAAPEKHARADDDKIRLLVWRGGALD
jgi:hypothetical protein